MHRRQGTNGCVGGQAGHHLLNQRERLRFFAWQPSHNRSLLYLPELFLLFLARIVKQLSSNPSFDALNATFEALQATPRCWFTTHDALSR